MKLRIVLIVAFILFVPATFVAVVIAGGLPALTHPTIPDDLHGRIVGKGARQQLEGCEVPSSNNYHSRV